MHRKINHAVAIFFAIILGFGCQISHAQNAPWQKMADGLFVGEFLSPQKSDVGDSKIVIIKINPRFYSLRLLSAKELHIQNLTAKKWCQKYNLIAAINAGMFQADGKTNVGYMKNFTFFNNPKINSAYQSVAAFNPIDSQKPPFRIYDTDSYNIHDIIKNYNTVIQNLRLIKRPRLNRWSQQSKKWSEAALGEDQQGNALFIFSRSPYSMHDLNKILLALPIHIVCAQHLEGGPEASLYFSYKNKTLELCGSYETDFNENDTNVSYWPIPNVIGVKKKE